MQFEAVGHGLTVLQKLGINRAQSLEVTHESQVRDSTQSVLEHFQQQTDATLKATRQHFDDSDDLRDKRDLLSGIDSITYRTAAFLPTNPGDIERFDSSEFVVTFAGLNPHLQMSGKQKGTYGLRALALPDYAQIFRCRPSRS